MNFEKVEIYGFKSFAEKAEIKFGDGITGIVGPNGCGKSNVADAIKWVLGEQSAKNLRGASMQDVIFAGTENRKSLSYCEVSLYFDNTNKMFSIDYNEVIITRKLFRSGESEYYINKQPARLKDIIDLLHECGIGKEGYTIIGQGKVESIMSAKPEDRRLIFEEATGIAKFKSRKLESERKLDRTKENLVRLADIMTEIENQLSPLEKQAEKAKEFNELSEQLKFHEINTYVAKVENVGNAKNEIDIKIKGINEQTALRENELKEADALRERTLLEINQADALLKTLNEELSDKRVEMERSSGSFKLFEQKISYLQGQVERSEKDMQDNKGIIDSGNDSLIKIAESHATLKNEYDEKTKTAKQLNAKLLNLNERISLGEELAESNRQKVIESIESLSDAKVSKGTISIEKQSLLDKKKDLTDELDSLSVEREKLFNKKETIDNNITELDRAVSDAKNSILLKEDEVRNGNEKCAKIEEKIAVLNSIITTLKTKDAVYKGLSENYEGYNQSIKSLFQAVKTDKEVSKRVCDVVSKIIKTEKKYDVAIETTLMSAVQNVVVPTEEDANYLINYLKANKIGRITFLPITAVSPRQQTVEVTNALNEYGALGVADRLVQFDVKYENVISSLLGNTLVVDNIDNATAIAKKYRFGLKIVTLDGDLITPQGSMTGGYRNPANLGLLSNDRKIEDNAKDLALKEKDMEGFKAQKQEADEFRDKQIDELSVLNELYSSKRQEAVLEKEKLSNAERELSEVGRKIENTNALIEEIDDRIAEIDERYQKASSGSEQLEKNKLSATLDANRHQQEYDAMVKERDKLVDESTSLQINLAEIEGKLNSLEMDKDRISRSVMEAKSANERLLSSIENAKQIIEDVRKEQEKVALTEEQKAVIDEVRTRIDKVDETKLELNKKLTASEDTINSAREQINALTEKKHAEELSLTKIDADLEYLGQSIFEDYQETYETAVKQKAENYDAKAGETEILRLRKKRSSLGAINANAIEEFKVISERYNEMKTQREDMEKAESDLKEAVDKIKAEMLSQFDEGFEKINTNFQRIFKELFGGGKAELQLDYENTDDKLEAGIEIVAEPPGKKLQKLSLLSGGEKALTAIAILFAILKLRPMPFCVLDEIEAALDEANVDRFARYLQKFSTNTQFIVITHRKPTMELADSLFGVTMEEKGVSRLVSVKLSDVADMALENGK